MINLVRIDCPLCHEKEFDFLFNSIDREHPIPGEFPVVRCVDCGLVYLNPRPDDDSLSECYPDDYDSYNYGVGIAGGLQKLLRSYPNYHSCAY